MVVRLIEDSMWARCFFEVYDKAKAEGRPNIEFAEVDKLVIEHSRLPISKLLPLLNNTK